MKNSTLEKILNNTKVLLEDFDDSENHENTSEESHSEAHEDTSDKKETPNDDKPKSPRAELAESIKPQADVANAIISSVNSSFQENCNNTKKIKDMEEQIKNWEKQIRGACQQVMSMVDMKKFDVTDKMKCSPRAYKTISNYDSRDRSTLDLCAAIIVFKNSLT